MDRTYISNFNWVIPETIEYDVIVVGSGIAGLYTALRVAPELKVLVLSKSDVDESNSHLAQGGIAASMTLEEIDGHLEDTLYAGCHYNDIEATRKLIEESRFNIQNLITFGVPFDLKEDGSIHMTKEGGHTDRRILHVKDRTGAEVTDVLLKRTAERSNIKLLSHQFVTDVLTHEGRVCGVRLINELAEEVFIASNHVVLATGGIGMLYQRTTNSGISTGDGVAMALRCGAQVKDMEFVQFHPTAYAGDEDQTFLVSEAVRGEGGRLVNDLGEYFMAEVHPMKDLAPRNIVSEAIDYQLLQGRTVYLEICHLDPEFVKTRFPMIYETLLEKGVDITKRPVPIKPSQHYFMGGILTNLDGMTTVEGLYACGECACTGVHGANRLASNSLLEALVYGNRIAQNFGKNLSVEKNKTHGDICISNTSCNEILEEFQAERLIDKIQALMTKSAFIVRYGDELEEAQTVIHKQLRLLSQLDARGIKACTAMNMILVAGQIIEGAFKRKESIGSHILAEGKE